MEEESFEKQLNINRLLKPELATITAKDTTDQAKIETILSLVKNKIKWNGRTPFFIDNVRKALKEGVGSSAEMNALVLSRLREAGYQAYPVVMSTKSNGRILTINPTIKNRYYFIVCALIDQSNCQ